MPSKVIMEIMTEVDGSVQFVWTSGRIDGVNANEFVQKFEEAVDMENKHVVLDLHYLRYISSAGLRGLLLIARDMFGRRKFVVCSIPDNIYDVFKVTGMDRVLTIVDDRKAALEFIQV